MVVSVAMHANMFVLVDAKSHNPSPITEQVSQGQAQDQSVDEGALVTNSK